MNIYKGQARGVSPSAFQIARAAMVVRAAAAKRKLVDATPEAWHDEKGVLMKRRQLFRHATSKAWHDGEGVRFGVKQKAGMSGLHRVSQ